MSSASDSRVPPPAEPFLKRNELKCVRSSTLKTVRGNYYHHHQLNGTRMAKSPFLPRSPDVDVDFSLPIPSSSMVAAVIRKNAEAQSPKRPRTAGVTSHQKKGIKRLVTSAPLERTSDSQTPPPTNQDSLPTVPSTTTLTVNEPHNLQEPGGSTITITSEASTAKTQGSTEHQQTESQQQQQQLSDNQSEVDEEQAKDNGFPSDPEPVQGMIVFKCGSLHEWLHLYSQDHHKHLNLYTFLKIHHKTLTNSVRGVKVPNPFRTAGSIFLMDRLFTLLPGKLDGFLNQLKNDLLLSIYPDWKYFPFPTANSEAEMNILWMVKLQDTLTQLPPYYEEILEGQVVQKKMRANNSTNIMKALGKWQEQQEKADMARAFGGWRRIMEASRYKQRMSSVIFTMSDRYERQVMKKFLFALKMNAAFMCDSAKLNERLRAAKEKEEERRDNKSAKLRREIRRVARQAFYLNESYFYSYFLPSPDNDCNCHSAAMARREKRYHAVKSTFRGRDVSDDDGSKKLKMDQQREMEQKLQYMKLKGCRIHSLLTDWWRHELRKAFIVRHLQEKKVDPTTHAGGIMLGYIEDDNDELADEILRNHQNQMKENIDKKAGGVYDAFSLRSPVNFLVLFNWIDCSTIPPLQDFPPEVINDQWKCADLVVHYSDQLFGQKIVPITAMDILNCTEERVFRLIARCYQYTSSIAMAHFNSKASDNALVENKAAREAANRLLRGLKARSKARDATQTPESEGDAIDIPLSRTDSSMSNISASSTVEDVMRKYKDNETQTDADTTNTHYSTIDASTQTPISMLRNWIMNNTEILGEMKEAGELEHCDSTDSVVSPMVQNASKLSLGGAPSFIAFANTGGGTTEAPSADAAAAAAAAVAAGTVVGSPPETPPPKKDPHAGGPPNTGRRKSIGTILTSGTLKETQSMPDPDADKQEQISKRKYTLLKFIKLADIVNQLSPTPQQDFELLLSMVEKYWRVFRRIYNYYSSLHYGSVDMTTSEWWILLNDCNIPNKRKYPKAAAISLFKRSIWSEKTAQSEFMDKEAANLKRGMLDAFSEFRPDLAGKLEDKLTGLDEIKSDSDKSRRRSVSSATGGGGAGLGDDSRYHKQESVMDDESTGPSSDAKPIEFVEALIRLSTDSRILLAGPGAKLADRFQMLLDQYIFVYAMQSDMESFHAQINSNVVQTVLYAHKNALGRAFSHYAKGTANKNHFTYETWMEFVRDCRLVEPPLTHDKASMLFSVVQEDKDPRMSWNEFLEALAAVCVFKNPSPWLALTYRLNDFFTKSLYPILKSKGIIQVKGDPLTTTDDSFRRATKQFTSSGVSGRRKSRKAHPGKDKSHAKKDSEGAAETQEEEDDPYNYTFGIAGAD